MTDEQSHGPVFNRERAAELVRDRGLSYARLAHLAQASPRSVRRWMAGSSTPAPYSLAKLAQALGVSPAELFTVAEGEEIDLRYLRIVGGFSLALLATETGLAAPYIHRVEGGKAQLTSAAAQLIAEALKVEVGAVITAATRHGRTAGIARTAVPRVARRRLLPTPPPRPAPQVATGEACRRAV